MVTSSKLDERLDNVVRTNPSDQRLWKELEPELEPLPVLVSLFCSSFELTPSNWRQSSVELLP